MGIGVLFAGLSGASLATAVVRHRVPISVPWSTIQGAGRLRIDPTRSLLGRVSSRFGARKARRAAQEQLPETIGALADAIRAGMTLPEALAFAADDAQGVLSGQLHSLVEAVDDGLPLEDALQRWLEAADDDRSIGLLVAVLSLQRRAGGDISTILDGVGRTIRDRVKSTREVASMTAQSRLSAAVIVLLPVGFLGFLAVTSPSDLAAALSSPIGMAAMAAGLLLDGLAFLWMRSLLRVEV